MVTQAQSFNLDKTDAMHLLTKLLGQADEFTVVIEGKNEPCEPPRADPPPVLYGFRHVCEHCSGILVITSIWNQILGAKNQFDEYNHRHSNERRDYSIHHFKTLDEITAFLASFGFPPKSVANTEAPQG